jgi:hypothetical protein
MRRRIAALLALLALVAAGCGGDEEAAKDSAEELDAPPLTVPGGDASELQDTAPTGTTPSTTPAEPGTGGTTPPSAEAVPPDSPEADTPPEPGTPPAQFEDFCDENPGACE